ncbi:MAG TPA: UPF0149 family protein [Gammaproteobacteria bacterium]|nr:UPF0149 family protein [Gammaproteobacteria bacterium]
MTPSSALPPLDYDRLRESLANAGAVVALAELHGGVCGALCAGGAPAARRWLEDCLDDQELATSTAAVAEELEELIGASEATLANPDLKFEPLLPDDDAPLDEQVQALALWCQGFLSGVGTTAPRAALPSDEGSSLAEILRDFAEISRAGLSEEEAAGQAQADFALAEIHEFVRVSVAVVFEELAALRAAATRDIH